MEFSKSSRLGFEEYFLSVFGILLIAPVAPAQASNARLTGVSKNENDSGIPDAGTSKQHEREYAPWRFTLRRS